MSEQEIFELIDKADVLMEKGKIYEAKDIYQKAYDNTKDSTTKDTLKEIIDNL